VVPVHVALSPSTMRGKARATSRVRLATADCNNMTGRAGRMAGTGAAEVPQRTKIQKEEADPAPKAVRRRS